jgi:hypothetical protein
MTRFAGALLFIAPLLLSAGKWKKELSKENITVWTRSVEGSDIREARGQTIINLEPRKLFLAMEDRDKFSKVVTDIVEWKDLGSCGENCTYVYEKMHHPPLKDRVYVIKVQWEEEETSKGVKIRQWWEKAKDKKPPGEGVEMVELYGSYLFEPAGGGKKTKFTYTYFVDPGGVAIAFFVNKSLAGSTFNILKALRKEAAGW